MIIFIGLEKNDKNIIEEEWNEKYVKTQWEEKYEKKKYLYPAYCVFIPSGLDKDFEEKILFKLQIWGENMGSNLYVAPWDLGDSSYVQLINKIGFIKRPAIILTDTEISNLDKDSFMVILDESHLLKDIDELIEILPRILDLIIIKDYKEAAKAAIESQKSSWKKSLSMDLKLALRKVKKLTLFWKGIELEVA